MSVLAYEWKRENLKREGKILSPKMKRAYIGLTEKQAREKLEEDKKTYNIYSISVYRSTNNWCKFICVNFGGMLLSFDKHTRKIISVY